MHSDFKLDKILLVDRQYYKIIGIHYYNLTNIYGEERKWISYTLQGKHRRWLTKRINDDYYLWSITTARNLKRKLSSAKICFDYSGLAFIKFKGRRGFSEPLAELLLFKVKRNRSKSLFSIERFIKQHKLKTYCYIGQGLSELNYVYRN